MEPPALREPPAIIAQVEQPPRRSVAAKATFQGSVDRSGQVAQLPDLRTNAVPNPRPSAQRGASAQVPIRRDGVATLRPCPT